jgi:beta-glucanase (GH16 family)
MRLSAWVRRPLVIGAVALPVVVVVAARPERPVEAVLNPYAATNPSDWRASSATSDTSLSQVTLTDGPQGVETALDVRREGDGGQWALALGGLRDPQHFFQAGHMYRMGAYVRDLQGSDQTIGMLLANSNFQHRPTDASRYAKFDDSSWHLMERTFVASAGGSADTALYFALPTKGSLDWQITGASVRELESPTPRTTQGPPDRALGFDGPAGGSPDPATWTFEVGGHGWGADELQTYTSGPSNLRLDGHGHLLLVARHEELTGPDGIARSYTSARVNTQQKLAVHPGSYVEARITAPTAKGSRPAFWLIGADWPQVGWPQSGELDVLEGTQRSPRLVRQTIHTSSASDPHQDSPYGGENTPGGLVDVGTPRDAGPHLYGVYFDENMVQFYVDRKPTLRLTAQEARDDGRTWPFGKPQTIVLNLAVGDGADTSAFPATMTVDAIDVWNRGIPL